MNIAKQAHLYDKYANIQYAVAGTLIKEAGAGKAAKVLEIGCGTGNYTRFLLEKFNDANIIAIDKSKKMIEIAKKKLNGKNLEFIVADAEDIELEEKFDLITSNAAFQWFKDLERALSKYKNILIEDGVISFSVFGPATFWELGYSLKTALGNHIAIDAAHFLKREEIETVMVKYFKNIIIREEVIKETFNSLKELLNKIRCTDTWSDTMKNILLWKKGAFKKTEDLYISNFGRIEASYQIFFCRGIK